MDNLAIENLIKFSIEHGGVLRHQREFIDLVERARRDNSRQVAALSSWQEKFINLCHCFICGREWIGNKGEENCPFCDRDAFFESLANRDADVARLERNQGGLS